MTHGKIENVYEHKPQGTPKQMVMFLHGLGADGRDLIDLGQLFASVLPDAVFVSPDAPYHCDMASMGYQWFSLQDRTPEIVLRGVQKVAPVLEEFITAQLAKYNLAADKLALVGFSQGTMMSLYVGPRYKDKIAGVLGYSGALVHPPEAASHRIPVCLVHGEADTIVPLSAYHGAKAGLEGAGFKVSGHSTPGLPHGIDDAGIKAGMAFLKEILG